MFGPSFGQQSSPSSYNNYFPSNGDYNNPTWSSQSSQQVNAGSGQQPQQQQQQQHSRKGPASTSYDYNNYNNSGSVSGKSSGNSSGGSNALQHQQHQRNDNSGSSGAGGGNIKHAEQGMQGLSLVGGRPSHAAPTAAHKPEPPKDTAPKQMTWASIASQPAKPQIRVRCTHAFNSLNIWLYTHFLIFLCRPTLARRS